MPDDPQDQMTLAGKPVPSPPPSKGTRKESPVERPRLFASPPDPTVMQRNLVAKHLTPPFSILDSRQGYWQERRADWIRQGITGEVRQHKNKTTFGAFNNTDFDENIRNLYGEGTVSVFDPLLCELMYRWYCPDGGVVLDPFAGGAVRGHVAAALGHKYYGIELRPEQIAENIAHGNQLLADVEFHNRSVQAPMWIEGDAAKLLVEAPQSDMIFTCPPYADLEIYSDIPGDISNMDKKNFEFAYTSIWNNAVARLKDNRFAVIVIGNVREKGGRMRDLVGLTIRAMENAGATYYDEALLLNAAGTAGIRANKQFTASRKLVRVHQHVVIFVKGDSRIATSLVHDATYDEVK